jgi:hypothetical protein
MEQLLTHLFGDYWLQSDYCAMNKSKRTWPCLVHVLLYTACFLILTTSWKALLVIGATHFIMDRWPIIIKRIIWLKNHLNPELSYVPFEKCDITGYYDNIKNEATDVMKSQWETTYNGYGARLNYITIWLYIITDNSLHLFINYMALKYL